MAETSKKLETSFALCTTCPAIALLAVTMTFQTGSFARTGEETWLANVAFIV
jgi:hypothetical protein